MGKSKVNKDSKSEKNIKKTVKEEVNLSKESTKKEKTKKVFKRIFDIIFWVAIICLAIIWLSDFIRLQNDKKPAFCLSEKTHKFEDGTVYECKGLGYNIYKYDRESIDISHQFSPFFIGMKK